MSAERRPHDGAPSSTEGTRSPSQPQITYEFRSPDAPTAVAADPTDSNPTDVPLQARIERARLRARVAALEDALETSERRRQAIIERYEHLLADREASSTDSSTTGSRRGSSLRRLLEAWL